MAVAEGAAAARAVEAAAAAAAAAMRAEATAAEGQRVVTRVGAAAMTVGSDSRGTMVAEEEAEAEAAAMVAVEAVLSEEWAERRRAAR